MNCRFDLFPKGTQCFCVIRIKRFIWMSVHIITENLCVTAFNPRLRRLPALGNVRFFHIKAGSDEYERNLCG